MRLMGNLLTMEGATKFKMVLDTLSSISNSIRVVSGRLYKQGKLAQAARPHAVLVLAATLSVTRVAETFWHARGRPPALLG